jgi:hypothetical protein
MSGFGNVEDLVKNRPKDRFAVLYLWAQHAGNRTVHHGRRFVSLAAHRSGYAQES